MTRDEAFEFLDRTARGIAETFGSSCETLVHDMGLPSHPILSIVLVPDGHGVQQPVPLPVQHIAPGGGGDGFPSGPEQATAGSWTTTP